MTRRIGPESGFTLVELLVVIAIIGGLVGFVLPAVQGEREDHNRRRTETLLKDICRAQSEFASTDADADGRADYARSLKELAHYGLIDPAFAKRKEEAGYRFDLFGGRDAAGGSFDWYAAAIPVSPENTGCSWFHIDRNDLVRETRREDCRQPDRLVLARTLLERLDLDGAVGGAADFLRVPENQEAILDVLDADGDGAFSSGELFEADLLSAARSVLARIAPGADRGAPIGSDGALRDAVTAIVGFVEGSLEIGAGGEGALPAVPRDGLSGDAAAFLDSPPAKPR